MSDHSYILCVLNLVVITMMKKVSMKNLSCMSCAGKIEKELEKMPSIKSASYNLPNQTMLLDVTKDFNDDVDILEIKEIVDKIEDGVETCPFGESLTKETKTDNSYITFFIGVGLYIIGFLLIQMNITLLELPIYWLGYLFIALKISKKTYHGVIRKDYFNENTLMLIASLSAMFLGYHFEAAMVIIFYTFGEYLQDRAVQKSRDDISSLIDLKVEYANVLENNEITKIDPLYIKINDTIIVRNGEKIPVDGNIIKGTTSLNTSALTGESIPTNVTVGDDILSGNINVGSVIHMKATKVYNDSTVAKMIELIENSTNNKAKAETFITTFARYYTPIVTLLALLMFLIPSIIDWDNYQVYSYRAATFLVVSCPCALILSVPLAYFAGIGASAKRGILFKGSSFLHMMTNVDTIGIDKTGTLTHGNFVLTDFTDEKTLQIAASLEHYSTHPIAQSIMDYYKGTLIEYERVDEMPGFGLIAHTIDGEIIVGNKKLHEQHNVAINDNIDAVGSYVYVSVSGKYLGYVVVSDTIKETSVDTIKRLKEHYNITMLTGDNDLIAKDIADQLGINYQSNLLPEDKINAFKNMDSAKNKVFIGDGINDAPLLKQADIGIAMGEGSELAIDVADVIIMNNDIHLLEKAFYLAHKTRNIVIQNIVLSLGIKFLFLLLAGFGISRMWMALFADVGIAVIAVFNSLRIIYTKKV